MIQEIITYLIILSAVAYTLYNFVIFVIPNKKNGSLNSCTGTCSACHIKNKAVVRVKFSDYN